MSIYQEGLAPAAVNHMALSPLSFIERTAAVYPNYPAVIHGSLRRNWQETYQRCRRLASALHGRGIRQGDTVAAMLPNIPAMLECHFGVPMIGAVLNTLNVRLDAEEGLHRSGDASASTGGPIRLSSSSCRSAHPSWAHVRMPR